MNQVNQLVFSFVNQDYSASDITDSLQHAQALDAFEVVKGGHFFIHFGILCDRSKLFAKIV